MIQARLLCANVWSLWITYKAFPHKFSDKNRIPHPKRSNQIANLAFHEDKVYFPLALGWAFVAYQLLSKN